MSLLRPSRRAVLAVGLIAAAALAAAYYYASRSHVDTSMSGAYRFDDGRLLAISPTLSAPYRYRFLEGGETRDLQVTDGLEYTAGPDLKTPEPVEVRVTFREGAGGAIDALTLERQAGPAQPARRLPLREEIFAFQSGELALRGKLVEPPGEGPFPAVVIVHGSGAESAVDYYYHPYLFAPQGIATLVYDKRGTGESDGVYTQDFRVLADDALAAVAWLRRRPSIDPERINLAGFSQGGWIAPLAASRDGGIRSLLIGYGPTVPVVEEDRWGYVYQLRRHGYGDEEIAKVDWINDVMREILDQGRSDRWPEFRRRLARHEDEEWFEVVRASDSVVGYISDTWIPLFAVRLYIDFVGITVDRLYDPVPALEALDVPMLWIFGGEDSSQPTQASIDVLERLRDERGKPIEIALFPTAEYGIFEFVGEGRERRRVGYAPDYFTTMTRWLSRQNGLGD